MNGYSPYFRILSIYCTLTLLFSPSECHIVRVATTIPSYLEVTFPAQFELNGVGPCRPRCGAVQLNFANSQNDDGYW